MKKQWKLLLLLALLAVGVVGCGNNDEEDKPSAKYENMEYDGPFDIEEARKNIIIKGQPFEIPVELEDISGGWTYEVEKESSYYLDAGNGLVYLYYNGQEMCSGGLENYYPENEKKSILYNLTVYTDDSCVDGVIPQKTTKQEVIQKYGEPTEITMSGAYYYGIVNGSKTLAGRLDNQCICIKFDSTDVVSSVSLTYADLTK